MTIVSSVVSRSNLSSCCVYGCKSLLLGIVMLVDHHFGCGLVSSRIIMLVNY